MSKKILDCSVLKKSNLDQMLEECFFNLPVPEPLPDRSVPTPYLLQSNFMKLFS